MNISNEIGGPKVIPLVDPETGEELKLTKDGTFQNLRTKSLFAVNDSGFIIALTDPITKEKAHLEKNYLVNDNTGQKYPINEKGEVIVKDKVISNKQPEKESQNQQLQKQTVKTETPQLQQKKEMPTITQTVRPPLKQIPIEVIYSDYVNRFLNLIIKESGVILEFVIDNNQICNSQAVSTLNNRKTVIYAQKFQYTKQFQYNVLYLLTKEFTKLSQAVSIRISRNNNQYDCIIRNEDNDSISFINIDNECVETLKNEIYKNTKKQEQVQNNFEEQKVEYKKDEKLETFKFYLVTITITLLITLCVLGIILLFG